MYFPISCSTGFGFGSPITYPPPPQAKATPRPKEPAGKMIGVFQQLLFRQRVARRGGRKMLVKDKSVAYFELCVIPQMLLPRQPPANLSAGGVNEALRRQFVPRSLTSGRSLRTMSRASSDRAEERLPPGIANRERRPRKIHEPRLPRRGRPGGAAEGFAQAGGLPGGSRARGPRRNPPRHLAPFQP